MSNATDNHIEAEKLIRTTFSKADVQERSLQICRWLLGFNSIEKGFKVKCYYAPNNQICFCVDRGRDCEAKRVHTWFLRISTLNLCFTLRPIVIEPNAAYLKIKIKELNGSRISYAEIKPPESKAISLELLKKHFIESYKLKLNELGLVSELSSTDNVLPQSFEHTKVAQVGSYLPTKEDFEAAYRLLTRPGESISIDAVLDQIEASAKKEGKMLKDDCRIITENNIENWAKNR